MFSSAACTRTTATRLTLKMKSFTAGPPAALTPRPPEVVQQAQARHPAAWNERPLKWNARRADPVVLPHPGGLGQALNSPNKVWGPETSDTQAMARLQWPGVSPRCDECDKLPDMSESCAQRTCLTANRRE